MYTYTIPYASLFKLAIIRFGRMCVTTASQSNHLNSVDHFCCCSCFASVAIVRYTQPMNCFFVHRPVSVESISFANQVMFNAIRLVLSQIIKTWKRYEKKISKKLAQVEKRFLPKVNYINRIKCAKNPVKMWFITCVYSRETSALDNNE